MKILNREPARQRKPAVAVERYYDKPWRTWVVLAIDEDGDQVGECQYAPNKQEADEITLFDLVGDQDDAGV